MEDMVFDKVICLLGDRGTGKTLFAVSLAHHYSSVGVKIFTNITFKGIKYIPLEFSEVAKMPDWLHDGIIILDEMHVGADSYKFLTTETQGITEFITQIRKRNLSFIFITQNFMTIAKRLRIQTNHTYQFLKLDTGIAKIDIFDNMNFYQHLNTIFFNGRQFYGFYDTKQLYKREKDNEITQSP